MLLQCSGSYLCLPVLHWGQRTGGHRGIRLVRGFADDVLLVQTPSLRIQNSWPLMSCGVHLGIPCRDRFQNSTHAGSRAALLCRYLEHAIWWCEMCRIERQTRSPARRYLLQEHSLKQGETASGVHLQTFRSQRSRTCKVYMVWYGMVWYGEYFAHHNLLKLNYATKQCLVETFFIAERSKIRKYPVCTLPFLSTRA